MLTLLALLLAVPQDPEALRQAMIAQCGIPADRLAVEQWTDPPMKVLMVQGDAPLADAQHLCIDAVISKASLDEDNEDGTNFTFGHDPLRVHHDAVIRRERVAAARAELASRGLLRRLPAYRPGRDDPAVFAKRLERLCGAKPGSLLKVQDDYGGNIVLRVDGKDPRSDALFQRELCGINALVATGFDPWGAMPPPVMID